MWRWTCILSCKLLKTFSSPYSGELRLHILYLSIISARVRECPVAFEVFFCRVAYHNTSLMAECQLASWLSAWDLCPRLGSASARRDTEEKTCKQEQQHNSNINNNSSFAERCARASARCFYDAKRFEQHIRTLDSNTINAFKE